MAVDLHSWSTTAASNTTINGIDIDEGWAAADINNSIRDMMAQLALLRKLISGSITTSGSANAQTLATGFSMSTYQQDMPMSFEAGFTNTASATLNVDSIGAKTLKFNGQNLLPGDLLAGDTYWATYESDGDVIRLYNPSGRSTKAGITAKTDSYTLVLADAGNLVTMSKATANTLTIPANSAVAFIIGTVIAVRQKGAGTTTVTADTGVTLNGTSTGSAALGGQFAGALLVKEGTDAWSIVGNHDTVA